MAARTFGIGLAVLVSALCGVALGEDLGEERVLRVVSEPSGAEVRLGGRLLGVTPLRVERSLPDRFTLELRLADHEPARVSVQAVASPVQVAVPLQPLPGRIVVSCEGDPPPAYDGRVSLREALLYARGEREAKGADRVYVRGRVGRGRADRIEVHPAVAAAGALFVSRDLPPLDDAGDALAGPQQGALSLLPAPEARCERGLELGPRVRVARLRVEGFPCGVRARGLGEARLEAVEVHSPLVALEAREGMSLRCEQVRARGGYARRIADGISLVLGELAHPQRRPRRLVTRRSPLGVRAQVSGGYLGGQTRMFQLAGAAKPLQGWEQVEARSSSVHVNAIFGAVLSPFRRAAGLVDRDPETHFRWQEEKRAAGAWLSLRFPRPVRGQRFRLVPATGDQLQRVRLLLLDPYDQPVATQELGPLQGPTEVELAAPQVFQTLRLEVLAASGKEPGLQALEAALVDTREVPRLGAAEGSVVFAPRDLERETLLLADRKLLSLPADPFRGELPLALPPGFAPSYVRRNPTRLRVTTLADEVRADDQLSLREALAAWASREPLAPGEEQHVRRAFGFKGRIELPPGAIQLRAPLPPLPDELELCGDPARGTQLRFAAAQASLGAVQGGGLALSDLELDRPLVFARRTTVALRRVKIRHQRPVLCQIPAARGVVLVDSELEAPLGLYCPRAEVFALGSRFKTGRASLVFDEGWTLACLGSRFVGEGAAFAPRNAHYTYRSWLALIGNQAPHTAPIDLSQARFPYAVMASGNQPPLLRFQPTRLGAPTPHPFGESRVLDLRRDPNAPFSLCFFDPADAADTPYLIRAPGGVRVAAGARLLLYDEPLELVWRSGKVERPTSWILPLRRPSRAAGRAGAPALAVARAGAPPGGGIRSDAGCWGGAPAPRLEALAPGERVPYAPGRVVARARTAFRAALGRAPREALRLARASYQRWGAPEFVEQLADAGGALVRAGGLGALDPAARASWARDPRLAHALALRLDELGVARFEAKDFGGARELFAAACELTPDPRLENNLLAALERFCDEQVAAGEPARALEAARAALERFPERERLRRLVRELEELK